MRTRVQLLPGPDHPITLAPVEGQVTVTRAGHTLVDTDRAVALTEAGYPQVYHLPREDADLSLPTAENACWTYESPYAAVTPIREHLAFYPGEVDLSVPGRRLDPGRLSTTAEWLRPRRQGATASSWARLSSTQRRGDRSGRSAVG